MDTDEERKNRYYGNGFNCYFVCMKKWTHFLISHILAVFKVDTILGVLRHSLGFGIYVFLESLW